MNRTPFTYQYTTLVNLLYLNFKLKPKHVGVPTYKTEKKVDDAQSHEGATPADQQHQRRRQQRGEKSTRRHAGLLDPHRRGARRAGPSAARPSLSRRRVEAAPRGAGRAAR